MAQWIFLLKIAVVCARDSVPCSPCVVAKANGSPSITSWHSQAFNLTFPETWRGVGLFHLSRSSPYGLFRSPFLDLSQRLVNRSDMFMLRMLTNGQRWRTFHVLFGRKRPNNMNVHLYNWAPFPRCHLQPSQTRLCRTWFPPTPVLHMSFIYNIICMSLNASLARSFLKSVNSVLHVKLRGFSDGFHSSGDLSS